MNSELFSAFCTYLTTARELLGPSAPPPRTGEALTLVRDSNERLRELVRRLEARPEFTRLVELTRENLAGPYHSPGETGWSFTVRRFFIRSGLYTDISKGRDVPNHEAFQAYLSEFQKTRVRLTTLVAIGNVTFASNSIDCGTFQIKHFTQEEMTALVRPDVRDVFYPSDVSGWDLAELAAFWYVRLEEELPADRLGVGPPALRLDVEEIGNERPLPTDSYEWFPAQLYPLLGHLALFDWQPTKWKELDFGTTRGPVQEEECEWCKRHHAKTHKKLVDEPVWKGLRPAFVLRCSDMWLLGRFAGYTLPDMFQFLWTFREDEEAGKIVQQVYGDIELDEAGTMEFAEFMRETGRLLAVLRPGTQDYSWEFLDRALKLLAHGSLSDGYEQLLQHVNVVETLLGDEKGGLARRLRKRVASLLGKTEAERKYLEDEFEVVYRLRSKHVHGEPLPATRPEGHIRSARRFARESSLCFVRFLSEVLGHEQEGRRLERAPTREKILSEIDNGRTSRVAW